MLSPHRFRAAAAAAQGIIDDWMQFYNRERPHSALGKATPDEAYGEDTELTKAA